MRELMCISAQISKNKTQSTRSLFVNVEMAVTPPPQPRFQAVGLAYLSVKLESFKKEIVI